MAENVIDLILFFVYSFFKVDFTQNKDKSKPWEADYQLVENAGLFQEYLEMGLFHENRDRFLEDRCCW